MFGYFQDNHGDKSMARLLAFMMQVGGVAIILVGLALIVVAFFARRADEVGALVGLVGIGGGMDAAGPAMKNWSKGAEARVDQAQGRVQDVVENEGLAGEGRGPGQEGMAGL